MPDHVASTVAFLLPMGNINPAAVVANNTIDVFLLPMGNINMSPQQQRDCIRALSTPYGKHKHWRRTEIGQYWPSFYSLWET